MKGINMIRMIDIFNPKIVDKKWIVGNKSCSYEKIKVFHKFMKLWCSPCCLGIPFLLSSYFDRNYNLELSMQIFIFVLLIFILYFISSLIFAIIYNYYAKGDE